MNTRETRPESGLSALLQLHSSPAPLGLQGRGLTRLLALPNRADDIMSEL